MLCKEYSLKRGKEKTDMGEAEDTRQDSRDPEEISALTG